MGTNMFNKISKFTAFLAVSLISLSFFTAHAADKHSYSNDTEIIGTHLHLDLTVLFSEKIMRGSAEYDIKIIDKSAKIFVLDTRDLEIRKIMVKSRNANSSKWTKTNFKVAARDPMMGSKLSIAIPAGTAKVKIFYNTLPKASGLQWLTPAQTAGKKHPFLFSQGQAIHTRSWIPIQDSPAMRITYTANIKTPKGLLAVMSAENEMGAEKDGDYQFKMPQKIPPYLIAIGVGDLYFKAMSDITGVYAEKYILDAAADEFSDTQAMIDASEKLYGPYRWGRYDILMLPPSFPFGGMENPRLSFITPTVVAGDKSLVGLIAHELAHSWSGNLITNSNWEDLWINEGFTSYVENRIMEVVYGERRAVMEQVLAIEGLRIDIKSLSDNDRTMNLNLDGRDPDDAFSNIPYTKGQMFLMYLEAKFTRAVFDPFMKNYFKTFSFQSMDTPKIKAFIKKELIDKNPDIVSMEEINFWIHDPKMPKNAPNPTSDVFVKVTKDQLAWLAGTLSLSDIPTANWTVHEWLKFLNDLPSDMDNAKMAQLDAAFDLTKSKNNEIAHVWLLQALRHGYYDMVKERLKDYMISIGRRKLIVPLYAELAKTEKGMKVARATFKIARPGYHPLAQGTIDKLLGLDK
jgi:aminopeptidase N